jgi:hypothetical protein
MAKKKPKKAAAAKTAAKKKKKKKNSAAAASAVQWEGRVFSFLGVDDGQIVQNTPNSFRLVPLLTDNESPPHGLIYQLKSEPTNGVLPLWQDVKFVWRPGKKFDLGFTPNSNPTQERPIRVEKTKNIVKPFKPKDYSKFEQLVGVSKLNNGADVALTLLVAQRNDPDGVKDWIVGIVTQSSASPNGAAVGNS